MHLLELNFKTALYDESSNFYFSFLFRKIRNLPSHFLGGFINVIKCQFVYSIFKKKKVVKLIVYV